MLSVRSIKVAVKASVRVAYIASLQVALFFSPVTTYVIRTFVLSELRREFLGKSVFYSGSAPTASAPDRIFDKYVGVSSGSRSYYD